VTTAQVERPTRGRRYLALVGVYGLLGLFMSWPLPLRLGSAIPGDGFDGWQNYWNLWWMRLSMLKLGTSPWHAPILDSPSGVSLYFHTLNAPNGLLSLPVHESLGPIAAYNAVVIASFALSGLGAYLLALRALGRGDLPERAAAFVAGLTYSLSPFHFAHLLGHMQVFALQWLPFYCLALMAALDRPRPPRLATATLFLVLAALTDWYNLFYLALLTLLWAAWHGWQQRRLHPLSGSALPVGRSRQPIIAAATVGLCSAVLLSPLLVPMVAEARRASYMVPDPAQIPTLSADLLAFVLPQEMQPLWGSLSRQVASHFTATTSEHMVSLGILPLALAALAWWKRRPRAQLFVWTGLLFAILALGPVLHVGGRVVTLAGRPLVLPYLLLYKLVPFAGIARTVGRFSVMASLATSVLAAMGLDWLARRARSGGRRRSLGPVALTTVVAILVCLEFLPAPYPMSAPDTPAWYLSLRQETGAVLNLPVNWDRPRYLLYQTVHGLPLVSAYTSRRDPVAPVEQYPGLQQLRALGPDVLAFPDAPTFATIAADLGLRWIVLDNYQMPGADERQATVDIAGRLLSGVAVAYHDGRLTVLRLQPPDVRRAYVRLTGMWGERTVVAGLPERAVCADCGVQVEAGTCPVRVRVTCASGSDGDAEVSGDAVIAMRDVAPTCRVVEKIEWFEQCQFGQTAGVSSPTVVGLAQ
jgi:hypothetical protein